MPDTHAVTIIDFAYIGRYAQPLLWVMVALLCTYFILRSRYILSYLGIDVTTKTIASLRVFVLLLLGLFFLLAIVWYIDSYVVNVTYALSLFTLGLLVLTLLFGLRAGFVAYLLISPFFIYYTGDPRYFSWSNRVDVIAVVYVVTILFISVFIGFVVRRHQHGLGIRVLQLRELHWRTRERLALKTEEETTLKAIHKASLALESTHSTLPAVLKIIAEESRKLTRAAYASIIVTDADARVLQNIATGSFRRDQYRRQLKGDVLALYEQLSGKLRPNAVTEVPPRLLDVKAQPVRRLYQKIITVTIDLGGKHATILVMRANNADQFDDRDKESLRLFGAHAGLAIKNTSHHEELTQLMKARDRFASALSHEVKTPLATIKLYAQLLQDQIAKRSPSQDTAKGLATIDTEVDRVTRLINTIVDFSRIDSGKFVIERKAFDLKKLVVERVDVLQKLQPEHKLQFKTDVKDARFIGDSFRIDQVITNIIVNACKYSPAGSEIGITLKATTSEYVLRVSDKGQGIAKEELSHIFEAFYQAGKLAKAAEGKIANAGLGLGLYITKEIIELHGGAIWVESSPGKGSTFFVQLPITVPDDASSQVARQKTESSQSTGKPPRTRSQIGMLR